MSPEHLEHTGIDVPAIVQPRPGPPDPLQLLQEAIAKGIDAKALETLCALSERWQANRAAEAYSAAMARCQRLLPPIVKDAENKSTRSRYATLERVNRAIVPVYTKEGLAISFTTEPSNLPEHIRIIADVTHELGHCKRFQADIPLDGVGAKGNVTAMNRVQATGSTYSYARRYLEYLIFNLTIANEDDDGQGDDAIISGEGVKGLENLMQQCADAGAPVDVVRFLQWLEVPSLAEVKLRRLDQACDWLRKKHAAALAKKKETKE